MNPSPRIALIHALTHSPPPINREFASRWPEARLMNLLDDSLSGDLAANPKGLDETMTRRFLVLADYAVTTGADAILFTCSAFGPCIDAVKTKHANIPVYKPNEAMIEEALALNRQTAGPIGLIASFGPTLVSMPPEFPSNSNLKTALAEGALDALNRGDLQAHDEAVAQAAIRLEKEGCTLIALTQFSLARAANLTRTRVKVPVLTTVESAVSALRSRF